MYKVLLLMLKNPFINNRKCFMAVNSQRWSKKIINLDAFREPAFTSSGDTPLMLISHTKKSRPLVVGCWVQKEKVQSENTYTGSCGRGGEPQYLGHITEPQCGRWKLKIRANTMSI